MGLSAGQDTDVNNNYEEITVRQTATGIRLLLEISTKENKPIVSDELNYPENLRNIGPRRIPISTKIIFVHLDSGVRSYTQKTFVD